METNTGEILKISIFTLLAILFILNSVLRAKKVQSACKLDFLNDVLNENNISTFVLVKKFMFVAMPKPFPTVKMENIQNFSYQKVLNEMDAVDKMTNSVNFSLGLVIFILACALGISYPETIQEIFDNSY